MNKFFRNIKRIIVDLLEREVVIWRYFLFVPMAFKLKTTGLKTARLILIRIYIVTIVFSILAFLIVWGQHYNPFSQKLVLALVLISSCFFCIMLWNMRYTIERSIKYVSIVVCMMFVSVSSILAGDIIGGYASDYLDFGVGARTMGMGGAGRAHGNDATAGYWNSALVADIKTIQINSMFTTLLADTSYSHIGFTLPVINDEMMAFNYIGLKTDGLERHTAATAAPEGYFDNAQGAFMVSYGKKVTDNLNVGLTGKYGYRTLDGHSDGVFTFDAGLQWKMEKLEIGTNIRNLLSFKLGESTEDQYNFDFDLGFNYKLSDLINFSLDLARILRGSAAYYAGAEYALLTKQDNGIGLKLRGGLNSHEMTVGLGMDYTPFSFDYAYIMGPLDAQHRMSLSLQLGESLQGYSQTSTDELYKLAMHQLETYNIDEAKKFVTKGLNQSPTHNALVGIQQRIKKSEIFFNLKLYGDDRKDERELYTTTLYAYVRGDFKNALKVVDHLLYQDQKPEIEKLRNLIEHDQSSLMLNVSETTLPETSVASISQKQIVSQPKIESIVTPKVSQPAKSTK